MDWLMPDWWSRAYQRGTPVIVDFEDVADRSDPKVFWRNVVSVRLVNATPSPVGSTDWVKELFATVPKAHVQRVYRALASAFHPDVGGDAETMKRINAAYGRIPKD